MDAKFVLADPASVDLTLKLTASVEEWERLRVVLASAPNGRSTDLSAQIGQMISAARKTLTSERWVTTSMAGEVSDG